MKTIGNGPIKRKGQICILFTKNVAYLAWVCVVVLPNRFQLLSNGKKKGTAFSQT